MRRFGAKILKIKYLADYEVVYVTISTFGRPRALNSERKAMMTTLLAVKIHRGRKGNSDKILKHEYAPNGETSPSRD
jgi:hypothetical protein